MSGLKPIKLFPARERVASELREAILSRRFSEGEILTQETTARELGVSITPVREAFQILARDGLIDLKQNKGAVVLGINEKMLREHYQVRAAMESAACALCCEEEKDISAVRQCLERADKALANQNSGSYTDYNQSFHYEIWNASGNEKLRRMLAELWNGLSMGLNSTEEEYASISQEEHRKICEAIEKKDADTARKEMEKHIYRSLDDILTRYP